MLKFWTSFALELGFFTLLGVLYYFYQKRKILHYEANKTPLVMEFILQSCLAERTDESLPALDGVIEALDDYLQNRASTPPKSLLTHFAHSAECSSELKDVILEGLKEIESI
jgi:hypothetical protein